MYVLANDLDSRASDLKLLAENKLVYRGMFSTDARIVDATWFHVEIGFCVGVREISDARRAELDHITDVQTRDYGAPGSDVATQARAIDALRAEMAEVVHLPLHE